MTHDPYVDSATSVLRNELGLTDAAALARCEFELSRIRAVELERRPVAGRLDRAHLEAVHRRLFGDVYDWAGQVRTIGIAKSEPVLGGRTVRYPHPDPAHAPEDLATRLGHALAALARDDLPRERDPERFADQLAHHVVELWHVHAFREGNTRTVTAFARQIARVAGHELAPDFPADAARYRDALVVAAAGGDREPLDREVRAALGLPAREPRAEMPDPDPAEVTGARDRLARETERRLRPMLAAHRTRSAALTAVVDDARRELEAFDARRAGRAAPRGARGERLRFERRDRSFALERARTALHRHEDDFVHDRARRDGAARDAAARALPDAAAVVRRAEERTAFDAALDAWRQAERRLGSAPDDGAARRLALIRVERLLDVHAHRTRLSSDERDRLASLRTTLAGGLGRDGGRTGGRGR